MAANLLQERVLKAIESVRPGIQADGGDIELVKIDDNNIVHIRLTGACDGCVLSTITLKQGIERIVKMLVPEVTAVEAI